MSSTGRSGLGVLRRLRLFDVVLWTVPPLAAALYLFGASVADYRRMAQFDDWWSNQARVDHFAWWRVRAALALPHAMRLDHGLSVEDTHRALVDLRVDRSLFDRIAEDPVGRAGEAVPAELALGNALLEVELRLRGDTSVHWSGEKKTLAMKSARGEMFQGNRTTVFSAKEVLPQFAANSLALDFDLIAPPTAVVPVFLNQRFYGMFRAFAPLDETFLRNAGRIPGNIFRGDTAERGDVFKHLPRELFLNPYIWDRVAYNDRPGAIGTAKLAKFVALVAAVNGGELASAGETQALERLFEILDKGEISRLFALMLVVGDPWHTSGVHNHFWYEDSSSGLLHPIPWDLRTLDLDRPPPGANYNRFWRAALADPRVFAGALREIHERNRDGALLARSAARLQATFERYRDGFEYDNLRCGPAGRAPNPEVGTPEEVLGTLERNLATLSGWCEDARASYTIGPNCLTLDGVVLDVVVDGRAPVEFLGLEAVVPGTAEGEWRVHADLDLDGASSADDALLAEDPAAPGSEGREGREGRAGREDRALFAAPLVLHPGVCARERLSFEPLAYRFFVSSPDHEVGNFRPLLRNALTGAAVAPREFAFGTTVAPTTSAHPWSFREPAAREIVLAGTEVLTETLEVPRNTTLVIEAGARLVLGPDVSIHCRGRIEARGTAAAPIEFESADERAPWGSLALQGPGADGSLFQHVKFQGGGGALLDDVEYTGMVCVHWARGVRFEDCEFSGNLRCDDALHADVAEVDVTRSWFHDTNADAVDFDISTGTIEGCLVERAGNDGFDLMTCSPRIVQNEIRDNGDKGISIGEDSSPLVFSNTITGCNRGIEVKDRSSPTLLNNTIEGNRAGVLARLKNWRYEKGGWPRLVRTRVTGNGKDLVLEKDARATLLDARIAGNGAQPAGSDTEDLRWLYALQGLAADATEPGAGAGNWRTISPAVVVAEERFPDDWTAPEATWRRSGGVASVRAEEDCLVVRLGAEPGSIARTVAWRLLDPERVYWLVVEAAASDLESAALHVARTGKATLDVPLRLESDPDRFAYTVVPLEPGAVSELAFSAVPRTRIDHSPVLRLRTPGALFVHRWFVVSAARADVGGAR